MSTQPISESMRLALELLADGKWREIGYRGLRSNTLEALERRRFAECRMVWPGGRLAARITNTGYAELIR